MSAAVTVGAAPPDIDGWEAETWNALALVAHEIEDGPSAPDLVAKLTSLLEAATNAGAARLGWTLRHLLAVLAGSRALRPASERARILDAELAGLGPSPGRDALARAYAAASVAPPWLAEDVTDTRPT